MNRNLKSVGQSVAAVVFIALVSLVYRVMTMDPSYIPAQASTISTAALTAQIPDGAQDVDMVRRGQYLVRVGDCASCHTMDGGAFLAGGLALNTPFGTIYSTNLTSDVDVGVGRWSADQFYDALHHGKSMSGQNLYPAMPYPYMTQTTRMDSDAIFAFLKTIPAAHVQARSNDLPFPFNVRLLVSGWNAVNFKEGEFKPDPSQSEAWNRGSYLVNGLGHCAACHSPKSVTEGDKSGQAFQGGTLDNWTAPDLTGNTRTGLGSWNADDIVEYLSTGRNAHANAGGSMAEVVAFSTSIMTKPDLEAIATYLKALPASPDVTATAADAGVMKRGAEIYSDACSSCHMADGKGQPRLFPPLPGNAVAQQNDPTGVLHIILAGDRTAPTDVRPSPLAMPSFGWKLTDREIADVSTFIRNSWGNKATSITESQVAKLRKTLQLETDTAKEPTDTNPPSAPKATTVGASG